MTKFEKLFEEIMNDDDSNVTTYEKELAELNIDFQKEIQYWKNSPAHAYDIPENIQDAKNIFRGKLRDLRKKYNIETPVKK